MNEFDQKAQDWDKNKMHIERTLAIADRLKKLIQEKPAMKAMEFGAGTGLLSFYLKDRFLEITLMDSSREMLKMAEQKMEAGDHSKIKTLFLNLELEEYIGDPFNIIYSQMVLHHIKDINAILKKFYHLLTPGGILAIADLYQEDGSFHDGDLNVHRGFNPEDLTSILLKQGFNDIKIAPCFVIRKEVSAEIIKEYPVFVLTAFRKDFT
ncbi:MAG: class I SAM-dependent methyltransferase [Bacteroidetes bacterium]|nr:class I SAM-dependent methyltransferase [Bacteroidota bacterium]